MSRDNATGGKNLMQLELPRNRVMLLAIIAEQRAKHLLSGPLKAGLIDVASELNALLNEHDKATTQKVEI